MELGTWHWMVTSADLPLIVERPNADAQLDASVAEEAEHSSYIGL